MNKLPLNYHPQPQNPGPGKSGNVGPGPSGHNPQPVTPAPGN